MQYNRTSMMFREVVALSFFRYCEPAIPNLVIICLSLNVESVFNAAHPETETAACAVGSRQGCELKRELMVRLT